ncbi:DUF2244 domain-containing protein [Kordiimonas marina]|uniref:DUF2244 domain-containing protein n=1 Tax=Kordiimonas marina TaxID=2872312 RepID=UPI001FF242D3|nr:DUF2244 domain-containing protein [Kordiimonas marina]MCJ9429844.1 DUF2244 domain-containing protein [Kordiimonas marina]
MMSDYSDINGRLEAAHDIEEASRDYLFSTTLYPRRSLPKKHYWRLIAVIAALSTFAIARFIIVGAWPVTIFVFVDILGLWLAFHLSYRQARHSETIQLTDKDLIVTRMAPSGRSESWRFDPYWCRIKLNPTDGGDSNELVVSSHGETLRVGTFLSPRERRLLADTLLRAIAPLKGY